MGKRRKITLKATLCSGLGNSDIYCCAFLGAETWMAVRVAGGYENGAFRAQAAAYCYLSWGTYHFA